MVFNEGNKFTENCKNIKIIFVLLSENITLTLRFITLIKKKAPKTYCLTQSTTERKVYKRQE